MANPLLEFVLSLVRDPEAAARYAADPEGAIAAAALTDVTRLDVNSLIPVVSESMSAGAVDDNVWTSGQAVAAFDAFGDELPVRDTDVDLDPAGGVVDTSLPGDVIDVADVADIVDDGAVDIPADMPAAVSVDSDDWFGDAGRVQPAEMDDLTDLPDSPFDAPGFDAFGQ